ncbi:hypothetical protein [Rhodanobacter sp. DHG33]|uniref:hypothetical protein n=1 Tax=Rhodanobacter sp. DHG33 TaxID=2775921 RepID=UPI0017857926|nr:hypothetical protein [Rhodanobacter sp. DHG33]MBD8900060.1 hypothetical protein [Rhodanobacter sp. DHG33]
MSRSIPRYLRRCRVLFALALCAWLGLATAVFAKADCCADMQGMATMTHHHGAPAPVHANGMHADCACAHMTATLPVFALPVGSAHFAAAAWRPRPATAPDRARAPPLRPPLA